MQSMELGDFPNDHVKQMFKSNCAHHGTSGQHKQGFMRVFMELDVTGYIIFLGIGHEKSDQKNGKNLNDLYLQQPKRRSF